jgi:Cu(I)/Ag(I) efflux system protein CusF
MKKLQMMIVGIGLLAATPVSLAQSTMTDGLVIKIDQVAGKITIKHGPLKQFEMDEGMTMVYRTDDPAMLKSVRVGDKVKFMADRANGQFSVTKIEKAR